MSPGSGAIFLGTEGSGVFVSRDGGASWRVTGPGGPLDPHSILAAPDAEGSIYALAFDSPGFFRCRGLCESWELLQVQGPIAFALDAGDPGILYEASFYGVRRSKDGGQSWEQTTLTAYTFALSSDPIRPGRVYASTDLGLFQTGDGASTWTAVPSAPAVSVPANNWIVAAGIDDGSLYVLTDLGLFRTEDRGMHWVDLAPPFDAFNVRAMAEQPGHPGRVLAATQSGVWRSEDAGSHWPFQALSGEGQIWAIAFDPTNPSHAYAATSAAAFARSADGGETWTASSEGITNAFLFPIAVEPSSSGTAYAGGISLWKTANGGRRWKQTSGPSRSFAIVPTPSTLYAANSAALFRSLDHAESWHPATGSGLPTGARFSALAAAQGSPAIVFLGTDAGLFRSLDSGESFSHITGISEGRVDAFVMDATARSLYAATSECSTDYRPFFPHHCVAHLYKSANGGAGWQALPLTLPIDDSILLIAVDPRRPSRVFIVHSIGLEGSEDGGESWRNISFGEEGSSLSAILFDPNRPETLYAATGQRGVLTSRDGGTTWSTFAPAPPGSISSLALDPSADLLYAASYPTGVFELSLTSARIPHLLPFR